jgi:nicotinate-nucleotide adenylyltransferase
MLNAAVAGHPDLRVDDREVKRGGTTYTYDTVIELQEENPDAEISLVLGADAVSRLGTWHRSAELSQRVKVVMVARPGHQPNVPEGWKVTTVMAPQIDISSTALRDAVAAERTIEFLVPDSVRDLILREGLYRVGRD